MTPFSGDIMDFCKFQNVDYGRDKGFHDIERYCGTEFTLVIPEQSNL